MPGPDDLQPTVTLVLSGDVIEASWPAIAQADGYHLAVTDEAGTVVYSTDIPAAQYTPPVALAAPGIVPGHAYTVVVYVTGEPSAPATIEMETADSILAGLRDRLMTARTQPDTTVASYVYPLDRNAF